MESILQFKKVNCKDCYKCVRYCPVKAIEVKNHRAQIIDQECVLCGNCTLVCPQKAKKDISDVQKIKEIMRDGRPVVASLAPSYAAYFDVAGMDEMRSLLQKMRFLDAYETAEGAYLVKSAYEDLMEKGWKDVIISSCCATVNLLIRKHYPEALPYLAPVLTPMLTHGEILKERHPDAAVVFIGPCISKKEECREKGSQVDYAITFTELKGWMEEFDLHPESELHEDQRLSRNFPTTGGILKTLKPADGYRHVAVDGLEACERTLKDVVAGKLKGCFIEMSACAGSCVGGPAFQERRLSPVVARLKVEDTAGDVYEADFQPAERPEMETTYKSDRISYMPPSEKQIAAILQKMGKHTLEDELNCGMCGYPSCRDKAIAVFFGKAEVSMCLPYMKERAESFSDKIINVTPNAILAVDMDMKVQQINAAACEIFGLAAEDIVGQPVSRILDEFDFVNMVTEDKAKVTRNAFLAEYNIYLEQSFLYDKASGIIVCVMKNITSEKRKQNELRKQKVQAANLADEIVDKQLRIVHEIASLLGETAAETKIAVNDLKQTILMDE